jgi:protein-S-isoprenylcysteine O-methyltransferase Ste14
MYIQSVKINSLILKVLLFFNLLLCYLINGASIISFKLKNQIIMEKEKDSPGIFIPPPLFYVLVFLLAIFFQKKMPINDSFFHLRFTKMLGGAFLILATLFLIRSLGQFLQSKNTVVTIKPASSLQTNGIYNITRNPMYVGLLIVYLGISCLIGNWWNIIFLPLLCLIIQQYIIRREEEYLERRFGREFLAYKSKVRRWL